jgi:rSAM/selenodomain-associated transferase 1
MACAIAVMAKVPHPGRCKTRLVPPLSPENAAALSAAFLRDMTENLRILSESVPIAPYVAYAPAGAETHFDGLLAPGTSLLLADGRAELPETVVGFGRCLLHALQGLFDRGFSSVCLLNSDSPTLPTSYLRRAAELLEMQGDRVVLGPADDGGYYLIGVKQPHAHLFSDIAWSTDAVAAQTRARAREAGIPLTELSPWYDVDDAESLSRLRDDLAEPTRYAYPAPFTAACLENQVRHAVHDLAHDTARHATGTAHQAPSC